MPITGMSNESLNEDRDNEAIIMIAITTAIIFMTSALVWKITELQIKDPSPRPA